MNRNIFLFWLMIITIIINTLDFITSTFILDAESNPIFLMTNNIYILLIGKILILSIVYYIYKKNIFPSNIWYYSCISILIIGIFGVGAGVISNVYGILNPEIIEAGSQISTQQKISYYSIITTLIMIIPYLLSILSFYVYERSIKYTRIIRK